MGIFSVISKSKGFRATLLGAFGLSCWYCGTYYERNGHNLGTISRALPVVCSADLPVDPNRMALVEKRTREIMRLGFPSLTNIRSFDDFILSYDNRTRIASWVFEHLTEENLKVTENVDRAHCEFTEDKSIHPFFRSKNEDYKRSGFDRGHLAAAGNHRMNQLHCNQTFTLSNIAPQVGVGFNRDAWNKLEKYVRKLTKKFSDVYVCTGPIFKPHKEADGKSYVKYQVIGDSQVAVPTHFFKVVVMLSYDEKLFMECYLMPNAVIPDSTPLTTFMVPLETIQRLSGLLFFDGPAAEKLKPIDAKKSSFW